MKKTILITTDGLLAGERCLREHGYDFQDGTSIGFHIEFVKLLVSEILCASGLAVEMPHDPRLQPRAKDGEVSASTL